MDLGEVLLMVILVYGFVPGVGFALMESGVSKVNDNRLYYGYALEQLEYVETLFLLFAGNFALFYSFFRHPVIGKIDHLGETERLVGPVFAAAIAMTALLYATNIIWGTDVGNEYISSYLRLRSAPVIVQQFSGIGTQIQLALILAAISFAVAAWPKHHVYVALVLFVNIGFAVISGGSRANAFLALLAYVVAASIYVPAFRVRRAVLLAIPVLFLFLLAGLIRSNRDEFQFLSFLDNSEFTAVFVTALDLHKRLPEGFSGQAPFNIYAVDLLRFIPSQLLPFEKTDPSNWYVSSYYYSYYDRGGAYAFGALAEIVLGQGIPDAIVRGAVLGIILAHVANRLHTANASPIRIVAYVWLMVVGYQCYRDTTFSIAARALFHLSPVLIFIALLHSSRRAGPAAKSARAA